MVYSVTLYVFGHVGWLEEDFNVTYKDGSKPSQSRHLVASQRTNFPSNFSSSSGHVSLIWLC